MSEEKFVFESLQDPRSIKEFLQSIIDGIEKGRVILTTQDEEIVLHPGPLLKFSVKAKKKSDSSKLNLTISWKDGKRENLRVNQNISIAS